MTGGGILALDVATTTGWAHGQPGGAPQWGHFRAGKRGAASGEILALFRAWLDERCRELAPRVVVFESPYVPRSTPKTVRTATGRKVWTAPSAGPPIDIYVLRRLISMCGLVEMIAAEHRIECREQEPNTITKAFTGFGGWGGREGKKAATVAMCQRIYGWDVADDNEADALALFVYAESVLFPAAAQRRGAGPLFARAG